MLEIKSIDMTCSTERGQLYFNAADLPELDKGIITVTLDIGDEHEEASSLFSFYIVIGEDQEAKQMYESYVSDNYPAVYFCNFSKSSITDTISERFKDANKGNFEDSLPFLRKLFLWEFEGEKILD
ncbi:hypothetical protein [uncultured Roseibium sp.]|uniref:hypothetical protein n=1 Tax=uncultured Roseibium sp. TaxID=1936171 RepID=UPI0026268E6E|nr:hypothetical protein [uncultured Roseibium sp.]